MAMHLSFGCLNTNSSWLWLYRVYKSIEKHCRHFTCFQTNLGAAPVANAYRDFGFPQYNSVKTNYRIICKNLTVKILVLYNLKTFGKHWLYDTLLIWDAKCGKTSNIVQDLNTN